MVQVQEKTAPSMPIGDGDKPNSVRLLSCNHSVPDRGGDVRVAEICNLKPVHTCSNQPLDVFLSKRLVNDQNYTTGDIVNLVGEGPQGRLIMDLDQPVVERKLRSNT